MTLQEQIRANRWRTLLVYVMFALLAAGLAALLGLAFGTGFLVFFGVLAIAYGIYSWFAAGRIIAAAAGAVRVDPKQYPEAWGALETVAIGAGLPSTPPLYIIQDPAPNAFAAGRDPEHAYVAVTTGLLDTMPRRELEAVLAHEVSHVRNRDVRLMSLAAVLVGVIALVSDLVLKLTLFGGAGRDRRDNSASNVFVLVGVLAAAILAPLAASLLQLCALPAPGVPRRRIGGRGDRRCRGHGACAEAVAGRHEGHDAHLERDGAPATSSRPRTSARTSTSRGSGTPTPRSSRGSSGWRRPEGSRRRS